MLSQVISDLKQNDTEKPSSSNLKEKASHSKTLKKRNSKTKFSQHVVSVAGGVVSMKGSVSVIELMLGIGWLTQDKLTDWEQGKVPYLEQVIVASLGKISTVMKEFKAWAIHSKLEARFTEYKHKNCRLRFSKTGEPNIEKVYSTHYVLIKSDKNWISI